MQEVQAADKIKVFAEIELNESYSEDDETKIVSKTSNPIFEPGENAAANVHLDLNSNTKLIFSKDMLIFALKVILKIKVESGFKKWF